MLKTRTRTLKSPMLRRHQSLAVQFVAHSVGTVGEGARIQAAVRPNGFLVCFLNWRTTQHAERRGRYRLRRNTLPMSCGFSADILTNTVGCNAKKAPDKNP